MKKILSIIFIFLFLLLGCSKKEATQNKKASLLANSINNTFIYMHNEINKLRRDLEDILLRQKSLSKQLKSKRQYAFFAKKAYYSLPQDSTCLIWASGEYPVNKTLIKKIHFLESFEPDIINTKNKSEFISRVFYISKESVIISYPYFDANTYLSPGLQLYKNNLNMFDISPEEFLKKEYYLTRPYVDAGGYGYVSSMYVPIYKNNSLEGLLGIDISISYLAKKLVINNVGPMLVVSKNLILIALNKEAKDILQISGLENYYYLKNAEYPLPIDDAKYLTKCNKAEVVQFGEKLKSEENFTTELCGTQYNVFTKLIPEIQWKVVMLSPQNN